MRYFVTGCAGFIGSSLVDYLLGLGHEVVGFDNFSTGQRRFLSDAQQQRGFSLVEGDLLDQARVTRAMDGAEFVFHLAANADVRFGTQSPRKDLEQNTIVTSNVLEAMRTTGARKIAFSSTGSVYGEPAVFPTPETCPFPIQTSLYGASKVAAEALISAYHFGFGMQAFIFRFVSILGERYTHGHVLDFYRKLCQDPKSIEVLGNGQQRKSYLYVQDCIRAMLVAIEHSNEGLGIFNLGTDEYTTVDASLGWISAELSLTPERRYTGEERGWIGDSPFIFLDCSKIRALGWRPNLRESVLRTLSFLRANPWVLEARVSEQICVYGLWHLGSVTAAGLASFGARVVGLDSDAERVAGLAHGTAPIVEPDLDSLLRLGLNAGRLSFTTDAAAALASSSVVWIAFDTPVDAKDEADINWLHAQLETIRPHIRPESIVVIASQVPVGFTTRLAERWLANDPTLTFACAPENLRLGSAVADFLGAEHIVVGVDARTQADHQRVLELFAHWGEGVQWTTVPSAEMSKHALNGFLAVSVAYANEVGRLCEQVGADASAVATWLRNDPRIGRRAYVAPGPPIAGGTLLRDVGYLTELGQRSGTSVPVLSAISTSNEVHQAWAARHLERMLGGVEGPTLALLGLTYKPGTNTLRRSSAVSVGIAMAERGVRVLAFDPAISLLPPEMGGIHLVTSLNQAIDGADVALLATAWPEFRALTAEQVVRHMRRPRIVDQHGMLKHLADDPRIEYVSVGRPSARSSAR